MAVAAAEAAQAVARALRLLEGRSASRGEVRQALRTGAPKGSRLRDLNEIF